MSKHELATRTSGLPIRNMDELARVADMMARSGFFTDAREAAQAGVKIMAGQAWGIDPFNAMTGIFIIKNKPTVSAGLMAAAVKGHEKYDYRVRERTDKACKIEFFQDGESLGVSEYTMDMAKRAELTSNPTWKKHPEAMLFARAMSAGVRTFTPDVFTSSVYTPEELGAEVDAEGDVIPESVTVEVDQEYVVATTEDDVTIDPDAEKAQVVKDVEEADKAIGLIEKACSAAHVGSALEFAEGIVGRELGSLYDLEREEMRLVYQEARGIAKAEKEAAA